MLTNIYFPWGAGLGTLGFRFKTHYVDFSIVSGALQLFVAQYTIFDKNHFTNRSWYHLKNFSWILVKREDAWGEWKNGKRRPPLYEPPEGGIVQRAWDLRQYFKPYQIIDWYGEQREVISFPCPENNRVTLMIREFNDPTTLTEVVLENYVPEYGPIAEGRR